MMRLSEIYRSVQGEGPKVGIPTTFVRFGGCNLRCPGWACDTPHAIFPAQYRHEWEKVTPDELTERIIEKSMPGENICLTGGEPFLQSNTELQRLTDVLYVSDRRIECFSNGTLPIPEWAFANVDFVFDWKLPGSGETTFNAEIFLANLHTALGSRNGSRRHSLKFTVTGWDDFQLAVARWSEFVGDGDHPNNYRLQVFVGPVWDKVEPSEIVQWILECDLPWRLNIQTHKYVWDPDERRR